MRAELKGIAYHEAAALLRADMDATDLQCEDALSEADAEQVREYIRNEMAQMLDLLGDAVVKPKKTRAR